MKQWTCKEAAKMLGIGMNPQPSQSLVPPVVEEGFLPYLAYFAGDAIDMVLSKGRKTLLRHKKGHSPVHGHRDKWLAHIKRGIRMLEVACRLGLDGWWADNATDAIHNCTRIYTLVEGISHGLDEKLLCDVLSRHTLDLLRQSDSLTEFRIKLFGEHGTWGDGVEHPNTRILEILARTSGKICMKEQLKALRFVRLIHPARLN